MDKHMQRTLQQLQRTAEVAKKLSAMQAGRNLCSKDFAHIPRNEAEANFTVFAGAEIGALKKLKNGKWQRTNSSSLELVRIANEAEQTVKSQIEKDNKTQNARDIKMSNSPKASAADKQEALSKAAALRNRLNGNPADIKNDLTKSDVPLAKPANVPLQDALKPFDGISGAALKLPLRAGNILQLAHVGSASSVVRNLEGVATSASDLSFSGLNVEVFHVGNKAACSREILEDAPEILAAVIRDNQKALGKYLDQQFVSGSDIVSGSNIKSHADVIEVNAASVAAVALTDINAVCSAHDGSEDLVLAMHPSFFHGVFQDLLATSGISLARENGELFYNNHRIVLSDGLEGASASSAGDVLAVAGSLAEGLVIAEQSPLEVKENHETLANRDQVLVTLRAKLGVAVRNANAIARLTLS